MPFPQRSFDLVILHCTLDDLAASSLSPNASFDALAFLKKVVAVLVPGGLVAGCVDNRYDSKFFLRGMAQRWCGQDNRHAKAGLSLAKLRSLLDAAQLTDIRLFSLLPGCDSPLRLVDSDPGISRLAFRHELEARREYLSTPSYLARRAVIELGLSRHLESAIFFWGYRAC